MLTDCDDKNGKNRNAMNAKAVLDKPRATDREVFAP